MDSENTLLEKNNNDLKNINNELKNVNMKLQNENVNDYPNECIAKWFHDIIIILCQGKSSGYIDSLFDNLIKFFLQIDGDDQFVIK